MFLLALGEATTPVMFLIESNWETPETFSNNGSGPFNMYSLQAIRLYFYFHSMDKEIKVQKNPEIYPVLHNEGPKDKC